LPDSSQDRTAFARVVRALRPYLDELVFVGGWAHRLLALHELAGALDFQPLMTSDADIATEGRSRVQGSSMRDLLRQNGFTEELSGDEDRLLRRTGWEKRRVRLVDADLPRASRRVLWQAR